MVEETVVEAAAEEEVVEVEVGESGNGSGEEEERDEREVRPAASASCMRAGWIVFCEPPLTKEHPSSMAAHA